MAGKTNLTSTLFSQKKLLGKTSTGVHRADNQEPLPSGLQVSAQSTFAEDIPASPSKTLWTTQGTESTVEYVEFIVQAITGSTYDANSYDSGASAQSSGNHAYRLVMTGNYESLTNNTNAGDDYFVDDQILHWTLGGLQLVSPGFSNNIPNPYALSIYKGDDDVEDEIPLLDETDWYIDYFSGVLFLQDYDASKIPTRAKGFIYTGQMLNEKMSTLGGGVSGAAVGWYASGNSTISTTGSLLVGTNTATPANADISFTAIGAAVFNEQARNADFRVETLNKENAIFVDASEDRVLVLSGGAAGSNNESTYTDTNFFVSGAIGTKNTAVKGTSVFGGDLHVSGNLTVGGSSPGGGGSGVSFSGGNGSNNHMITSDGAGDIVAETNISFYGNTLSVTGSILPGSDKLYDLGSETSRFANIYTGDLHLKNERGHWQIIEELDYLTVINRITGQKYKMMLEPITENKAPKKE